MVDLRDCKPGDKLRSIHGEILTYIGPLPESDYYDHVVRYPDGSSGTRIHDGHVYRNPSKRLPEDHDIVEIIARPKGRGRTSVRYKANGGSLDNAETGEQILVMVPTRCTNKRLREIVKLTANMLNNIERGKELRAPRAEG